MNKLHVVGIGLDGLDGLSASVRSLLHLSPVIAGPKSHLDRVSSCSGRKLQLPKSVQDWPERLRQELHTSDVALLATGDPLFFGIGRLLTQHFSAKQLQFYPHLSCIQLACNRLHIPQQTLTTVSVHGRSLDGLVAALKQGRSPIAVLTDFHHSPGAIAQLLQQLQLPVRYQLSVCSQLGGPEERIDTYVPSQLDELQSQTFTFPNIVILQQVPSDERPPNDLPVFGIPDRHFLTFPDRPGLITKQEVRTLSLSLLQLPTSGIIWDVGAGTGSVSIEIARLVPNATIYAVEKNSVGLQLIAANARRFQTPNVREIAGIAPAALESLPSPSRVFVGGGGQSLPDILQLCTQRLQPGGLIVGNFATLESCTQAQHHFKSVNFCVRSLQVNLSRSVAIAQSTRFSPLNPVTLLQAVSNESLDLD
ncbi:MAG: precorrin-6y C5,15-methyltransferase (decarboxylating) subunit CbiE [Cyanobacteria bacterium P01_E01_bin.34]